MVTHEAHRLQLQPDRWYGWQMIPGYSGQRNVPYFSPIRVHAVIPRKTGQRILQVGFFNMLYAPGVQDFTADLRILKHQPNYLVAEVYAPSPQQRDRTVVISHIEFDWIRTTCPQLWADRPPARFGRSAETSVTTYLEALRGR